MPPPVDALTYYRSGNSVYHLHLDTYLSTHEARHTLTYLIDAMEQLNLLLIRANTTSFFEAFYIGMLTEVDHEPF